MKLSLLQWVVGALLALVGSVLTSGVALAADPDFVLSFDPSEIAQPSPAPAITVPPAPIAAPDPEAPLPIPAHARNPPMRFHSPQQLPSGVNRQVVAVAIDQGATPAAILPPAPPRLEPLPPVVGATAEPIPAVPEVAEPQPQPPAADTVVLAFGIAPLPESLVAQANPPPSTAPMLTQLFEGGSQSLVARAVGSAEGTRTPAGEITPAYYGHTDPGNRAWNMGTFSYQHGATSATEADQKQLQRLQSQTDVLKRRALKQGLTLTLEETLNGIDLANQSPLAAIGRVGYIERLAEVKQWGLTGSEAIVVARTRSYLNPNTGRWNAPGLGNTEASITRDQRRRTTAIAQALEAYRQDQPSLVPTLTVIGPPSEVTPPQPVASAPAAVDPLPAAIAIQVWPDGSESLPSSTVAVNPGMDSSINPATSTSTWFEAREATQMSLVVEASAVSTDTPTELPASLPEPLPVAPVPIPELPTVEPAIADTDPTMLDFPTPELPPDGGFISDRPLTAEGLVPAPAAKPTQGKSKLQAAIASGLSWLAPFPQPTTPTSTEDAVTSEPLTPGASTSAPLTPAAATSDLSVPGASMPQLVPSDSSIPDASTAEPPAVPSPLAAP